MLTSRWRELIFAASMVLAMGSVEALAQPLAEHVPADAQVYIGWSGADAMGPGFEGSNFQGFLNAVDVPGVSKQVLGTLRTLAANNADANEAIGLFAEIADVLWRKPTAIYFAGLETEAPNLPRFALLSRTGESGAALRDKLNKLFPQGHPPLRAEMVGDLFVLTIADKAKEAMTPAASLAAHPRFKEAMAMLGREGDAPAVFYADPPAFNKMVVELMTRQSNTGGAAEYQKVVSALGLDGLHRIVAAAGFDGKDWSTHAFIEAPAPRKGLLKLLDPGVVDDATLELVPATSPWFAAAKFDLGQAYDIFHQAIADIHPREIGSFDQNLAQLNKEVGFDIVNDLIRSMGSDWVFYGDQSLGGPAASTLALVHPLRDAVKFDKALTVIEEKIDQMLKGQGGDQQLVTFQRIKSGDVTVRSVSILLFAVSWSVHEGRFVLSMYPQSVVAAVDNTKGQGKSILDEPKFAAIRERLGGGTANAISFSDLEKTAPQMYQALVMYTQLAQGFIKQQGGGDVQLLLPPLNRLMPYFKPAGQVSWTDEKGLHMRGVSPFPGSSLFSPQSAMTGAAPAAVAVGVLLPSLGRARELANRSMAGTRLRGIYVAAELYAQQNGNYPKRPGDLVADSSVSPKNFINARVGTKEPVGNDINVLAAWTNDNSDYIVHFDRFAEDAPFDRVLGYEKIQPGISEGINILFGDGHVEFQAEAQAIRTLKEAGEDVPDRFPTRSQPALSDLFSLFNPGSRNTSQPAAGEPGQAWYYDVVTGEYFTDKTTKVAPFKRENGNEAVRAHFFTCGDCADGQRFVGYYEKYTDEVKKKIEDKSDAFQIYEMAFQGRLYSKDGKKWFPADKPDGIAITSELQKKCPPKKLRYCPPQ